MLIAVLALAMQAAVPSKLQLLCTQMSDDGVPIRWLFTVDGATKTFTATRNDTDPFIGTAELTPDAVTLHREDAVYNSTFSISRTTGDMKIEHRPKNYPYVAHVTGTCTKFTGKAF